MLFLNYFKQSFFSFICLGFSEVASGVSDEEAQKNDSNSEVKKQEEGKGRKLIIEEKEIKEEETALQKRTKVLLEKKGNINERLQKVRDDLKDPKYHGPIDMWGNRKERKELESDENGLEAELLTINGELSGIEERLKKIPDIRDVLEKLGSIREKIRIEKEFKGKEAMILSKNLENDRPSQEDFDSDERKSLEMKEDGLSKRVLELMEQEDFIQKKYERNKKGQIVLTETDSDPEKEKIKENIDKKMSGMTFEDFLVNVTKRDKRLEYVTRGNVNGNNLVEGKTVEINFMFGGKYNRDIYDKTTAGTVFNEKIREIEIGGKLYKRSGILGEFFSESGERGLIHDRTKVTIKKKITGEEVKGLEAEVKEKMKEIGHKEWTAREYLIAEEALNRNIDPEFAVELLGSIPSVVEGGKVDEDLFIEIDRQKGYFHREFSNTFNARGEYNTVEGDDTHFYSIEFVAYVCANINPGEGIYESCAKALGYKEEVIKDGKKVNELADGNTFRESQTVISYKGRLKNEDLATISGLGETEILKLRNTRRFRPKSESTKRLFQVAAATCGLPREWCENEALHEILGKESGGQVGRLNYTMKGMSTNEYKKVALNTATRNPFGVRSTASGLGQLLLSNIDRYYPSGRNGIGDPIEEAVGYLKYIKERYGSPEVAKQMYGRTGNYTHAVTGKSETKGFQEGY